MKTNYLFPNKYNKVGWAILIPSAIIGLISLNYEPDFLDFKLPAFFIDELFNDRPILRMVKNNILNEISGVLLIISSLLVAFSKEKIEDEYIVRIRLESLVWAVYVNYAILLISFLLLFEFSFYWVMVFNIFTILLFFIVRFNWQISKTKKSAKYEE